MLNAPNPNGAGQPNRADVPPFFFFCFFIHVSIVTTSQTDANGPSIPLFYLHDLKCKVL